MLVIVLTMCSVQGVCVWTDVKSLTREIDGALYLTSTVTLYNL